MQQEVGSDNQLSACLLCTHKNAYKITKAPGKTSSLKGHRAICVVLRALQEVGDMNDLFETKDRKQYTVSCKSQKGVKMVAKWNQKEAEAV